MRLRYQHRRQALLDALARHLPQARVCTGAAGLFELVELPEGTDEPALVAAAAERGVGVEGLALHRFNPGGPPGLVLGFGCLSEPAIDRGVRLLAEALREVEDRPQ
jgi:GntR family transcriptional regulator/MocR family aminotransferase